MNFLLPHIVEPNSDEFQGTEQKSNIKHDFHNVVGSDLIYMNFRIIIEK